MNKIDINELHAHVQKLPVLPSIVLELLNTIDQEEIDLDSIAKKIACDQVLTVKILRLANSSFYGMQYKISSVHEAINILGFKNVRMLIAASAIASSFNTVKIKHFSFPNFWLHSIGTAICAKEIAARTGFSQESAFISGLINGIGKLVLVTHYPKQFEHALEYQIQNQCDSEQAELATLGINHREINKYVLSHWKLPEEMQLAVSMPVLSENGVEHELSRVIYLANIFALALDFAKDQHAFIPKISPQVWEKVNLDKITCHQIFASASSKFDELSQSLIS